MVLDVGEMKINQLPNLSRFVIPEDEKSDSILEINMNTMREGQMELGIILSRYYGDDDKEDANRVIFAMKAMAMVYEELEGIKYEVLKHIYRK